MYVPYYRIYNRTLKSALIFSEKEKFLVVCQTWILKTVSLNRSPEGDRQMAETAAAQGIISY